MLILLALLLFIWNDILIIYQKMPLYLNLRVRLSWTHRPFLFYFINASKVHLLKRLLAFDFLSSISTFEARSVVMLIISPISFFINYSFLFVTLNLFQGLTNYVCYNKAMKKTCAVYIMTNYSETSLYIGVTSNLQKRVWEHKNKVVEDLLKNIT